MKEDFRTPMVIVIRDGWGCNPHPEHAKFNAVELARTPRCDALKREFPWTLIHTSGEDVGLPEGTMGNSEVGHQNIGAGRIVDQESVRISKAIRTGEFFENPILHTAVQQARRTNRRVHLLGLASDAGVHALLDHLYGCLELCRRTDQQEVFLHLFTDGRDTGPFTGKGFIEQIEQVCGEKQVGRIASICGRYYAMDRDNRWERVRTAYEMLTGRSAFPAFESAAAAVADYYEHPTNDSQQGDEFITPRLIGADWEQTRIADGDVVIFFNYRGDRPRELVRAFVMPEFFGHVPPSPDTGARGFERGCKLDLLFATMTAYEQELNQWVKVAYPKPPKMADICGHWLARKGLKQFRCAETEKFPHVTFFFNDYRDAAFDGEDRQIIQSPKVATYDLKPEMSAQGVCDAVLRALDQDYAMLIVNFANGDMVGHTGKVDAAIAAIETVDECVGRIIDKTLSKGGSAIVTADHGNAEQMWDPQTAAPHTAHTLYNVECILVDERYRGGNVSLRSDGRLADIIPTAFRVMGLEQPPAMTGQSLLA